MLVTWVAILETGGRHLQPCISRCEAGQTENRRRSFPCATELVLVSKPGFDSNYTMNDDIGAHSPTNGRNTFGFIRPWIILSLLRGIGAPTQPLGDSILLVVPEL